jgi:hypothetical protein
VSKLLTSWKEIANYLGKSVRTVQRWESDAELPVRRPLNKARGVVSASPEEIDAWLETHQFLSTQKTLPNPSEALRTSSTFRLELAEAKQTSRNLRALGRVVLREVTEERQRLMVQIESLRSRLE